MSVGTAFHPRTAPDNRKMQWREWSGYFAASVYADFHDIEYNAIREQAALIDVSPLYKYEVRGRDAERLVDRVITRDATKLKDGAVYYSPWCDEDGKVVDDGTIHRLAADRFRWTAADPQYRWLTMNASGPRRRDRGRQRVDSPRSPSRVRGAGRSSRPPPASRSPTCATSGAGRRRSPGRRSTSAGPATPATSATSCGSRPTARSTSGTPCVAAGKPYGIRPAGMVALDVVRLEAGLILLEVDYTSARHAMNADQAYSPYEIGLGRLVDLAKADFVGKRALAAEQRAGGPARRLVGIELDWDDIVALYDAQGLPPAAPAMVSRAQTPLYDASGGRQIGRVTSLGWSPILKKPIALASVPASHEPVGSSLSVEWTVEGRRGRVGATVVPAAVPRPAPQAGLATAGSTGAQAIEVERPSGRTRAGCSPSTTG